MFIIPLNLLNQICLVSGVHQKLGYFNYEVNYFCERHIAKYFLEKKKYGKRGHKKDFLIKREKIKKEFLSSITKINNPFIIIVNKYIRHIYSEEYGESFKRLLSKAFFIVLEQIYIKFAIQFSEFYNCYTSKKKDIKSILFVIFDIKKISRIDQKINESFTPVLNYFFSTYLYEDLRYFPKDLKDKIRNSDQEKIVFLKYFKTFLVLYKKKILSYYKPIKEIILNYFFV
ncbi:hypothetical protein TUBRATIS_23930 [Tubulinosema ratisbonensis]|uniref:Uncharacterized protein n=1 Tax=Tubulinosema ratisbonensis TaxID=291195 RepID=A0A437AJ03_9MICR|nr:hypothetical protein TUBRATIS_23930 [Tubulinosema ratisbonensis]